MNRIDNSEKFFVFLSTQEDEVVMCGIIEYRNLASKYIELCNLADNFLPYHPIIPKQLISHLMSELERGVVNASLFRA